MALNPEANIVELGGLARFQAVLLVDMPLVVA
jgi:hypothetical protein